MITGTLQDSLTDGDPSDTLEFAWAQDAVDSAAQMAAVAFAVDPASWDTFTYHDVPPVPDADPDTPVAFDFTI
jgi:hypothetical protein